MRKQNRIDGRLKHDLMDGFYHPLMLRRFIITILPASLVLVGLPFIWTFSSWSIIGWDGLSEHWQLVWQLQLFAFCFHVVLIGISYITEKWVHGILLFGYTLLIAKIGFDLMIMPMTAAIDRQIYEEVSIFYMTILYTGVYVLMAFSLNINIPTKKMTAFHILLLLSIVIGMFYPFVRYYKLLPLLYNAELIWMSIVCSFTYYAIMIYIGNMTEVLITYIRYPSVRVVASEKDD